MTYYLRIGSRDIVWAANALPTQLRDRADFVLPYDGATEFSTIKTRDGRALYIIHRHLDSVYSVHTLSATGIGPKLIDLKREELSSFVETLNNEA